MLYPFKVLDRVNLFDIDVVYDGIGFTAQAIATRLAISKALCSFISSKEVEYLRLAGLLTDDARRKERKQPGKRNARRKYKLYVLLFLLNFIFIFFILVENVKIFSNHSDICFFSLTK